MALTLRFSAYLLHNPGGDVHGSAQRWQNVLHRVRYGLRHFVLKVLYILRAFVVRAPIGADGPISDNASRRQSVAVRRVAVVQRP